MFFKFNQKGIKFLCIMVHCKVLTAEILMVANVTIFDFPKADTLEAAAYMLSLKLREAVSLDESMLSIPTGEEFDRFEILDESDL